MKKVFLSIGSNLGNRLHNFHVALKHLNSISKITNTSFLYKTAPLYNRQQDYFLNSTIQIETDLLPEVLLNALKQIESVHFHMCIKR